MTGAARQVETYRQAIRHDPAAYFDDPGRPEAGMIRRRAVHRLGREDRT